MSFATHEERNPDLYAEMSPSLCLSCQLSCLENICQPAKTCLFNEEESPLRSALPTESPVEGGVEASLHCSVIAESLCEKGL